MTERKALTRTQTILILQRQATGPILCGCGCGFPLDPVNEKVIDEHGLARKLCEPGSEAERDVLENRSFYRWPCAVEKTKADLATIAKAKAQAGETGQYARRLKRGGGSIKSPVNGWPPKGSRPLGSRKMSTGRADKRGGYEGEAGVNSNPVADSTGKGRG